MRCLCCWMLSSEWGVLVLDVWVVWVTDGCVCVCRSAKMGKTRCRRVVFIWAIRDASASPFPHPLPLISHHHPYSTNAFFTLIVFAGHVNWIASTLASALALAPPTLDVAIHVHVTTAPRGGLDAGSWYADSIHEDHEDHDAPEPEEREEPESEKRKEPENEKREEPESEKREEHDPDPEKRASRISEPRASRISELDAVNVVGGRPDLEALLREEVDAAPRGSRMSVSGTFILIRRPNCADHGLLSAQCAARSRLRTPCGARCGSRYRAPRALCVGARASRCMWRVLGMRREVAWLECLYT